MKMLHLYLLKLVNHKEFVYKQITSVIRVGYFLREQHIHLYN